jgi:hypothetical protein
MKLILLCRSRYDTFPIEPGSALEIPVYWDLAVIALEARPLTGALRRTENVPLCMAYLAMSLSNHEEAIRTYRCGNIHHPPPLMGLLSYPVNAYG